MQNYLSRYTEIFSRNTWSIKWCTCCNSWQKRKHFRANLCDFWKCHTPQRSNPTNAEWNLWRVFFFLFVKSDSGRKSWLSKLSKGDEKGDSDRCSDEFSHTGGFISSPLANSVRRTYNSHGVAQKAQMHGCGLYEVNTVCLQVKKTGCFCSFQSSCIPAFLSLYVTRPSWKPLSSGVFISLSKHDMANLWPQRRKRRN